MQLELTDPDGFWLMLDVETETFNEPAGFATLRTEPVTTLSRVVEAIHMDEDDFLLALPVRDAIVRLGGGDFDRGWSVVEGALE